MQRSMVLLPEPLGPMITVHLPFGDGEADIVERPLFRP